MLSQFGQVKLSVPDLLGLMERFYQIIIGRTVFYKILTSKLDKIDFCAI